MSEKDDATQRIEETDQRLRSIEAGDAQASEEETEDLTRERERLLNKVDDEL